MRLVHRPRLFPTPDPGESSFLGRFLRSETVGGATALAAAVVALVWANTAGGSYHQLRTLPVGPLDLEHSNVSRTWQDIGAPDWPDARGWERLRAADRLEDLVPPASTAVSDGRLALDFELPMPAISLVEVVPLR